MRFQAVRKVLILSLSAVGVLAACGPAARFAPKPGEIISKPALPEPVVAGADTPSFEPRRNAQKSFWPEESAKPSRPDAGVDAKSQTGAEESSPAADAKSSESEPAQVEDESQTVPTKPKSEAKPQTEIIVPPPVRNPRRSGPKAKTPEDFKELCASASKAASRRAVCVLVNRVRVKKGLEPVRLDRSLTAVADLYARKMNDQGFFAHVSPDGSTMPSRLRAGAITFRYAGENIAQGQPTPVEVVRDWLESPGHRANILNRKYGRLGVGRSGNTWVQIFAD